jgi:hypothetical protein
MNSAGATAAFLLLAFATASAQTARKAVVVLSQPNLVAAPPCVPRESVDPAELQRLFRFASIPDGFAEWQRRDCFPRILDDPTLARTIAPAGTIVTIAGKDAVVRDLGTGWLGDCVAAGVPASGSQAVTGSDLLSVIERIAGTPVLSAADIREIGIAKGRRAEGGGPVFALSLGTLREMVRVQCFEEVGPMVERAATAMEQAQRAGAR